MNKKSLLLIAFFSLGSMSLSAHALWIKTSGTAIKGQKHLVEIVWAEDGHSEQMPVDKWFSDMKDFELFVTGPDGTRRQIEVTADKDRYTGYFTPGQDGGYVLGITHTAKDLGGTAKLEYNAMALVNVGRSSGRKSIPAIDNELRLTGDYRNSYKTGQTINFSYLFKNAPREKIKVEVFSPSGWNRTFETDAEGNIELPLLWNGHYAVEANYFSEDESGTFNDKPFKATWRCVTYAFDSN